MCVCVCALALFSCDAFATPPPSQLHKSYKDTTDGANQNFKKLELEDARRAEFIKLQEQLIHKYQENLAHWSKVLATNYNECTLRNGALKAQRDAIQQHCNGLLVVVPRRFPLLTSLLFALLCAELKSRMKRFRVFQTKRLTELTVASRAALQSNEQKLARAQKILALAELSRKMETEREKVVPFYQSTPLPPQLLAATASASAAASANANEKQSEEAGGSARDSMADVNEVFGLSAAEAQGLGLTSSAAGQKPGLQAGAMHLDGSAVGPWSYLHNFHKKYNKVLLDKLAIQQEKKRLQKVSGGGAEWKGLVCSLLTHAMCVCAPTPCAGELGFAWHSEAVPRWYQHHRRCGRSRQPGTSVTATTTTTTSPPPFSHSVLLCVQLLIVNGKVNLVEKMPVRRGPRVTQEAVQIVGNYTTQARARNK